MSGLVDLQAAVASLQAEQTAVINEIQSLQSAVGDPDATVETLAQQINASVAAIQAAIPATAPAVTNTASTPTATATTSSAQFTPVAPGT